MLGGGACCHHPEECRCLGLALILWKGSLFLTCTPWLLLFLTWNTVSPPFFTDLSILQSQVQIPLSQGGSPSPGPYIVSSPDLAVICMTGLLFSHQTTVLGPHTITRCVLNDSNLLFSWTNCFFCCFWYSLHSRYGASFSPILQPHERALWLFSSQELHHLPQGI